MSMSEIIAIMIHNTPHFFNRCTRLDITMTDALFLECVYNILTFGKYQRQIRGVVSKLKLEKLPPHVSIFLN